MNQLKILVVLEGTFCLLIEQMFQLKDMFACWPSNITMRHSIEATAANRFFLVGKILSTAIQGHFVFLRLWLIMLCMIKFAPLL